MSSIVLPSTVEELNYMQSAAQSMYSVKSDNISEKGFENILVANQYKREFSLPEGVNWNVFDYDSYLNFEENNNASCLKADDCIVPGEEAEQRQRVDSFSESFPSSMEDKRSVTYQSMVGVKTFNTVCMDSGSTCISSEHSYVSPSPPVYRGLDEEETYQNLSTYFKQTPDSVHNTDSLSSISPVSSPVNDANTLDSYSVLNNFSAISHCSQDSFGSEISSSVVSSMKRPAQSPDLSDASFVPSSKRSCGSDYTEARKKNNVSSKNCRKTRKEKQKEMEARVADLEREREQLNSSIEMLEKAIKAHHVHLCSILGSRQQQAAMLQV